MASYAELRYPSASSTGAYFETCILPTALHSQIRFPYLGASQVEAGVGILPSYCALTVGLTEDPGHTQVIFSHSSGASESTADDCPSSQVELANDENEYIDTLAAEIQEYSYARDRAAGEDVHAHIISCGLDADRYLANLLVLMYGNCCSIEAAETMFHKILSPNIYSSNILINAYVTNEDLHKAKIAFGNMPKRNVASWNSIISALAQNGCGKDALQYYSGMLAEGFQPNVVTFVSAVDACADATELAKGMMLHSAIVACGYSSDIIIATALINMYGQSGSLDCARDVFRELTWHDVMSWSAMISACANNHCNKEALEMFDRMQTIGLKPSRSTFLAILNACGNLKDLSMGYEVHACMLSDDIESDIIAENALMNMYGLCQSLPDVVSIFCKMLHRNIISWSTIIAAHVQNDKNEEGLDLFHLVQASCGNPNNLTLSIAFDACANLQALEEGQLIHNYSVCAGIEIDFIMVIALINMYGRCQTLVDAKAVFYRFNEHKVAVWNAMISACVLNGQYEEALRFVQEMQSEGIMLNRATFHIIDDLSNNEDWRHT